MSAISRDQVADHLVALAKLPAKGAGMKNLAAPQRIERAEREHLPKLSASTVRNRIRHLSAVLSYGVNRGWLQENPISAGGVGHQVARAASKQQHPLQ